MTGLMDRMTLGEPGVARLVGSDRRGRLWAFYAPITATGWTFLAIVPEREALAGAKRSVRVAGALLGATLLLIVTSVFLVSGRLTRPIRRLDAAVQRIAEGDLDARAEGIEATDEIGRLAGRFNDMTADLRANIERLAEERAEREKVERELDLARAIQRDLLPSTIPDMAGFDIAGWSDPASKTGGDYYDWHELDDGRTVVTIADVAGHGIGPALIAAHCRAYVRASACVAQDLGAMMTRVNDLICQDVTDGRFVTAAAGIIDRDRSTMSFHSAGQGPILFYEAATMRVLSWKADSLPLGVIQGLSFATWREIHFQPGDALVLTTDGFFEWANSVGELYGTERLTKSIARHHALSARCMITAIHADVLAHARGTTQADDLTAVVIKRT
jgi:serine phosphatase RsbU (regulator of sigma subunit)